MAAVAVLVLGVQTVKVVALVGGALVVLSLGVAFVLEHGGELIRKWRANARD